MIGFLFGTLVGLLVFHDWAFGHGETGRLISSTVFILAAIEFVVALKKDYGRL